MNGYNKKQIIKICILIFLTVIINVVLYSEGFLGLRPALTNPLLTAFIITEIIGSVLFLIYFLSKILNEKEKPQIYSKKSFTKIEDYYEAVKDCRSKKIFSDKVDTMLIQIERIDEKYNTIKVILSEYFTEGEMTYDKFMNSVNLTKNMFFDNIKKIVNRISIFSEKEYKEITGTNDSRYEIYQKHIKYINDKMEMNKLILTKLDNLILEISKLEDNDKDGFNSIHAIEEIDALIKQTQYYKI